MTTNGSAETEIAWAAGFFDGEGSVFLSRRKGYLRPSGKYQTPYTLPCVSIHQSDTIPLKRFQVVTKVGGLDGPYKPSGLGKKLVYQYSIQGKIGTITVARILWPYLSLPKRKQFHRIWEELRLTLTPRSQNFEELPAL